MRKYKKCMGTFKEIVVNGDKMYKCSRCGRLEKELPPKGICEVSVCAVCGKRLGACECPDEDEK